MPPAGWLAQVCQPLFESRYLGREPFVLNGLARASVGTFDWSRFEAFLASVETEVTVTRQGTAVRCQPPRDLAGLREHFSRGDSVTARGVDRCCPSLRALAESVSRKLGSAGVSVLASPTRAATTWEYHDEQQFFVQAVGVQNYYFRPNTVAAHRSASGEFSSSFRVEDSRLWTARLSPGDVLYLPVRWWQRTDCAKDSLTIGVHVPESCSSPRAIDCPPSEAHAFAHLASKAYQEPRFLNLSSSLVVPSV